jgi:O-antigen/teichoic acid export membrane protein
LRTLGKVRKIIKAIRENEFAKNNLIFFIGSQLIALLNYLYYPVLGRLLPTAAFGELQVVLSLFTQMTIFIMVLTLVATNIIINEPDKKKANLVVSELEKFALFVALGILAMVILVSPLLKNALKFESALPFIGIALVFVSTVPLGFRGAFLRGKNDYVSTSVQGILASFSKIVLSAMLVVAGFKVLGATVGILLSQLLALVYAGYRAAKLGFCRELPLMSRLQWQVIKPQAGYAGLVLSVSLITTLLYSIDIAIIKYLFDPQVAGQYAGMSTIARIVLFLTQSFAIVLLTSIKLSNRPQVNSRLLVRSFLVTLALGGSATLVFILFPTQIVHLLFGTKYDAYTHLLPLLSAAMLIISLCNLLSNYHVALRHYGVTLLVGGGALLTALLLILFHSSPDDVVRSIAVGSGMMLAGLLAWTAYRAKFLL